MILVLFLILAAITIAAGVFVHPAILLALGFLFLVYLGMTWRGVPPADPTERRGPPW